MSSSYFSRHAFLQEKSNVNITWITMEGSSNFLTSWVVVEWRFRNGKDHCNLIISILIWNVISYIANREGLKKLQI